MHADDKLAEVRYAWEKSVFGSHIESQFHGPLFCEDFNHALPREDNMRVYPLQALVPEAWVSRWFDRETRAAMTAIRDALHAYVAQSSAGTFSIARECGGDLVAQLYNGGSRVLSDEERDSKYIRERWVLPVPLSIKWKEDPVEVAEQYREHWFWERVWQPS
jgi:hypothetical protein